LGGRAAIPVAADKVNIGQAEPGFAVIGRVDLPARGVETGKFTVPPVPRQRQGVGADGAAEFVYALVIQPQPRAAVDQAGQRACVAAA